MPQMNRVLRHEAIAPLIERHAVLSRTGRGLEKPLDRMEPKIVASNDDRGLFRPLRGGDAARAAVAAGKLHVL